MAHLVDRQVAGRVLLQPAPTVESRPRVSYSFHDLVKLEKSENVELHRQSSDGLKAGSHRSCSGQRSNHSRPGNDYSPGRPSPSANFRSGRMASSAFNNWSFPDFFEAKDDASCMTDPNKESSLISFEKTNSTFHMKVGTSHYAFCDQYGGLEHLHFGNWVGMHDFTFLSETDPALNFEPAPAAAPRIDAAVCAGVPTALKNALENGSISELLEDVRNTVRRVSGRLFFQDEAEEVNEPSDEEPDTHTASASSSHAPAGGLDLEADRVPTWAKKTAEPMTKYMFLDEGGDKGPGQLNIVVTSMTVKAEELELSSFSDVYAKFEEQSFSLLVLSDGRVWRLQGRLFGPVRAEENCSRPCECTEMALQECSTSLSPSGHKVVVTLRKTDAKMKWHRLIESTTQQDLSKDFI
eukprot:s153_g60.t1